MVVSEEEQMPRTPFHFNPLFSHVTLFGPIRAHNKVALILIPANGLLFSCARWSGNLPAEPVPLSGVIEYERVIRIATVPYSSNLYF